MDLQLEGKPATESVGQARQVRLHGGKPKHVRELEICCRGSSSARGRRR